MNAILKNAIVWDNHGCLPQSDPAPWLHELQQYRDGGVDVAMINLGDSDYPLENVIRMAAHLRGYIRDNADKYVLASSVEAIRRAKREGKLAIGFNIEGAFSIGEQLSLIQLYYDLGVRWMLMAYNSRNLVGAGCHDATDEGLSAFGRKFIAEMDRIGMIKCCSHTGYRTAMDVLTSTQVPTIFSHSNPRGLVEHPRNIPDELIDACAATGGVIGINGVGIFLSKDNDARPVLVAQHMDYVAQRVGAKHVGMGLDYVFNQAGMNAGLAKRSHIWPANLGYKPGIKFMSPREVPQLVEELQRLKWSDEDIAAALGGNLMRVAEAVWK